ncbi:MAG: FAD-dependent oxidoreductase [Dehalococcoidia bacterium]|nr:MAG: FAD-dependent oxidoreductase [Dehalococcoidia bacterium]
MNDYDVIIIGAGIGGLGVAGLLGRKGVKTLVLEKSKMPGGRAKTRDLPGGWRLDSGTHCVDNGDQSAAAQLLKKVGKEIPWTIPLEGVNLYRDGKWLSSADYYNLSDQEKKDMAAFNERFLAMSQDEIDRLDKVSLAQFIKENVTSPKIAEYFSIIGMIQSTLSKPEIISAGEFVAIFQEQLRTGKKSGDFGSVKMPLGGVGTMTRTQAAAAEEAGVKFEYATSVKKVTASKRGDIKIITEKAEYSAKRVVMALPIWDMVKLFSEDDEALPKGWLKYMKTLVDETSASIGFTLGARKSLFTEPVYLSGWSIPGVGLPLQIFLHTNFDKTIAPPDHMIAFIGACCTPEQARDEQFCKETWAKFWGTLQRMFPGLEENVVWKYDGNMVGIDGLGRSPGLTGKYRPPVFMKEVPGLYFAGDCYTGRGVGMNAAANSAMLCAEKIISDMGK